MIKARHDFEQQVGQLSSMLNASSILRNPQLLRRINGIVYFIPPQKAWYVFGDVPDAKATSFGERLFRALIGRRNLPADVPAFHDKPLWIGTTEGNAVRVDPPSKGPSRSVESISDLKHRITQKGTAFFGSKGFTLGGRKGTYKFTVRPTLRAHRALFSRPVTVEAPTLEGLNAKLDGIIGRITSHLQGKD